MTTFCDFLLLLNDEDCPLDILLALADMCEEEGKELHSVAWRYIWALGLKPFKVWYGYAWLNCVYVTVKHKRYTVNPYNVLPDALYTALGNYLGYQGEQEYVFSNRIIAYCQLAEAIVKKWRIKS